MSKEPLYNTELVEKVQNEIRVLFVDLGDALVWSHVLPEVKERLRKKYNLKGSE